MRRPYESLGTTVLGLLLAAALVLGCGHGEPEDAPRGEDARPNILLISLDALRADRLSCYGHERETSPFLDELATGGLLVRHSFVNTHGTPPSHATLFSSLYQETHRVSYRPKPGDWSSHRVPAGIPWLPEMLREAGYTTLGVTDGGFMTSRFGFDRGFDHFFGRAEGIESGAERLLELLARTGEGPTFAFLHTYEIHSPYDPPAEYRDLFGRFESSLEPSSEALRELQDDASSLGPEDLEFLRARYDAGIRYTDDRLRELFAALEAAGFLEHALVAVTSDHGEELGDHGGLLHRDTLYEELLRVPLILAGAGVAPGRVEERLVSTIDIAPTLLAAAGLAPHPLMAGRDLLSGAPKTGPERIFAQYADRRLAIRTRRFKLIVSPRERRLELYDLEADPGERHDLAAVERRRVARLRAEVLEWRASRTRIEDLEPGSAPLSADEQERLRALGYVD